MNEHIYLTLVRTLVHSLVNTLPRFNEAKVSREEQKIRSISWLLFVVSRFDENL